MNSEGNPMQRARRCGARARTRGGAPCRAPAMPNGRCRMHGGASTGPRRPAMRHGGYSKEMAELLREARRAVREANAKLAAMEKGGE
jgi:hypothetical protein